MVSHISKAQHSTSLRSVIERAAGMHTAPVAGTTVTLFGACDAEAHGRCPERTTVGARVLVCECPCHEGIDPAAWDKNFGTPWYADQTEAW